MPPATPPAPQLLLNMGAGQFIPNSLTSQLIDGCSGPRWTKYCFDLINFMFYGP